MDERDRKEERQEREDEAGDEGGGGAGQRGGGGSDAEWPRNVVCVTCGVGVGEMCVTRKGGRAARSHVRRG